MIYFSIQPTVVMFIPKPPCQAINRLFLCCLDGGARSCSFDYLLVVLSLNQVGGRLSQPTGSDQEDYDLGTSVTSRLTANSTTRLSPLGTQPRKAREGDHRDQQGITTKKQRDILYLVYTTMLSICVKPAVSVICIFSRLVEGLKKYLSLSLSAHHGSPTARRGKAKGWAMRLLR